MVKKDTPDERKAIFKVSPERSGVKGTIQAGADDNIPAAPEKVDAETLARLPAGWVNGKHATGRSSLSK